MHTKSNPQISKIAQAVVDVCPRPSISPRCPWCQGSGSRRYTGSRAYVHHSPWYGPTPLQRLSDAMVSRQITLIFLAGTGIPEYSGDSGVIRDSEVQRRFLKKIPLEKKRILRNPEESWQERKTGTKKWIFPETGKCNLACRGCSPKNVIFSNGPKIISEWSNLQYLVWIWYPESLVQ